MWGRQKGWSFAHKLARAMALGVLGSVFTACGGGGGGGDDESPSPPPTTPPPTRQFTNATNSTGISFVHGILNPTHSKAELFGGRCGRRRL